MLMSDWSSDVCSSDLADAWFVQHIEHARQAGTDLRGKADALALPAGQGAAGAIKVQIFKADIVEETHPLDDFLQYPLGDLALLVGQLVGKRERPLIGLIHRAADGVGDGFPRHLPGQRFRLQPRAVPRLARRGSLRSAERRVGKGW